MMAHHYPGGGWVAPGDETPSTRWRAQGRARACPRSTPWWPSCWRRTVSAGSTSWSESLLYEGYALYPYTPGATKNATPTPFGIVYPPAYAEGFPAHVRPLRDGLRLWPRASRLAPRCASWRPGASATRRERARAWSWTAPASERSTSMAVRGPRRDCGWSPCTRASALRVCVHNLTDGRRRPERGARGGAATGLLSTHVVVRTAAGGSSRRSRIRAATASNTFPVLATADDDVMLGATIVLPDHPQIAPESRGNLFDGTEIEEALLLHVHALSDAERAAIAEQDPAVREMIERAAAATPEDMLALHGVMRLESSTRRGARSRPTAREAAPSPPRPPGGDAEVHRRRRHLPPGRPSDHARRGGDPLRPDARRAHRHDRADPTRRTTTGFTSASPSTATRPGAAARHRPVPLLLRRGRWSRMSERNAILVPASATRGCTTTASAARWPAPGAARAAGGRRVFDFGTGGLDLAYEVMRGYDALVLVDASRQGGEPGTLYVMEPDRGGDPRGYRGRRDDQSARHGPADGAALREVAWAGGRARSWWWPASRRRRGDGPRAADDGRGGGGPGHRAWCWRQVEELRDARAVPEQRGPRHGRPPRRRRQVNAVHLPWAPCARSCRSRSTSTSRSSRATRSARARGWSRRDRGARALRRRAPGVGRWRRRSSAARPAAAATEVLTRRSS